LTNLLKYYISDSLNNFNNIDKLTIYGSMSNMLLVGRGVGEIGIVEIDAESAPMAC
jgi:hypothetical protein